MVGHRGLGCDSNLFHISGSWAVWDKEKSRFAVLKLFLQQTTAKAAEHEALVLGKFVHCFPHRWSGLFRGKPGIVQYYEQFEAPATHDENPAWSDYPYRLPKCLLLEACEDLTLAHEMRSRAHASPVQYLPEAHALSLAEQLCAALSVVHGALACLDPFRSCCCDDPSTGSPVRRWPILRVVWCAAAGVIHRDLKADNILVQHEHYLISDFGIALYKVSIYRRRFTNKRKEVITLS